MLFKQALVFKLQFKNLLTNGNGYCLFKNYIVY